MTEQEKYLDYLRMLRRPFQKLCRLRFLQPDGSTAFTLDNNPRGTRFGAFIADGTITHNWQNGRRTNASVTISNADGDFDYNFHTVWFGQEIALDEGLILSDGETEFYIQQGVFLIEEPDERVEPGSCTVNWNLVDKAAALDGALGGKLEGTYQVEVGTNIFSPISALLAEDRGNGQPVDRVTPVYTDYYNSMTQELPDGTTANMTDAPYTLTVEGGQTKWDVISGLAAMVNGWVGYDETGALRIDPSQDDILDDEKPVDWEFSTDETELLGLTYKVKNTEVFNDYIVVGEQLSDFSQPNGRAQILDSRSPVSIDAIGRKTIRVSQAGYGTDQQCRDYANFMVKRSSVLQRAVTISCSQIMHIRGNRLVTVTRTDKPGSPTERHLVHGFSRPLAGVGAMTINATSVQDFSVAALGSRGNFYFWSESAFSVSSYGGKTWNGTMECSVNAADWTVWDGTGDISSGAFKGKQFLFLRGTGNSTVTDRGSTRFVLTGSGIHAEGNIENILDYTTTANGQHPVPATGAFRGLFKDCTALVSGPVLGTESVPNDCCIDMFRGCTALVTPPKIMAKELKVNSFLRMFQDCTALTHAPELNAKTLGPYCYQHMFEGCTALLTVPALPAENTQTACYSYMFSGCSSIDNTDGLRLIAKTAANRCYERMFYNCSSLTAAPEIMAEALGTEACNNMFYGCTALVTAPKIHATAVAAESCMLMFYGCTSLTTLPKLHALTMANQCYNQMFIECSALKVSETQTGAYVYPWRIPDVGTGDASSASSWNTVMFYHTGGTFTGAPEVNKTYYVENEPV